tara:strand:+ start:1761 stop:2495 length:735 start_codon:yes stop_codon:yes gene_type:complete
MANLSVSFDFSFYNQVETVDQIISFSPSDLPGDRIILSVVTSGMTSGVEYKLDFVLTNSDDDIFQPKTQTFFASGSSQKFSTIANIIPKRTYILKATVTPAADTDSGASDIVTLLYDLGGVDDIPGEGIRNTGEYIALSDKPVKLINDVEKCRSQVPINAVINNAKKGKVYTYNFSSCEHNARNSVNFQPESGTITAGSTSQNISTIAKFLGDTNVFCLKLDVTSSDSSFSDYLLIQCKACSNE